MLSASATAADLQRERKAHEALRTVYRAEMAAHKTAKQEITRLRALLEGEGATAAQPTAKRKSSSDGNGRGKGGGKGGGKGRASKRPRM